MAYFGQKYVLFMEFNNKINAKYYSFLTMNTDVREKGIYFIEILFEFIFGLFTFISVKITEFLSSTRNKWLYSQNLKKFLSLY